jgi:hypothetical protein
MRKIFLSFLIVFCAFASGVFGQGIKQNLASDEVTAVSDSKITLKTSDGVIDAILSSATEYKRVPPENPSLKAAVASSLAEVGIGDKVMITGLVADDKKTMPAKAVYILTKSDLAQRQQKDQEWRTRGISGRITAINPQTKEITVKTAGFMATEIILTPKADAKYLRYPQDSLLFKDAKTSAFEEIAVGDSLRAVGDRSEDGKTFKAEQVLTEATQQINGTITAINAEKGEITINTPAKKDVVIAINKNTLFLKKFPPEMAQRMAQMQMMQAQGGGNVMRPPTQGGQQNPNQNPNQMQGGGMNRGGDFLENLPNITIADLKVGDMIGILIPKNANTGSVTAFKLLAGVEPFLKMPQMSGGGNRQGGGVNSNFSIPGLDGAGIP